MATREAVHRRRLNRQAASLIKQQTRAPHRAERAAAPSVAHAGLSDREQLLLREATKPLFSSGRIDLRYMGVAFLELHHLCWTPPFLKNDPLTEDMSMQRRDQWADEQFTLIWQWWTELGYGGRMLVIRESRFTQGA